jgi:hypothetical protein
MSQSCSVNEGNKEDINKKKRRNCVPGGGTALSARNNERFEHVDESRGAVDDDKGRADNELEETTGAEEPALEMEIGEPKKR